MIKKRLLPINIFFLRFQVYARAYVRIWSLRPWSYSLLWFFYFLFFSDCFFFFFNWVSVVADIVGTHTFSLISDIDFDEDNDVGY